MVASNLILRVILFVLPLAAFQAAEAGLINGGFETPAGVSTYVQTPQSNVTGWNTTASSGLIEIWKSGFNGVSSYQGAQHAEINATQVGNLYQDAPGIPVGSVVGFQFAHRGRYAGADTMRFSLTDLGPDGIFGTVDDTVLFTQVYSDTVTAWSFYTGTGIVALGNTVRFSFASISSNGGSGPPDGGNFLDAADFGIGVGLPVLPTVTVTKVSNGGVGTFNFTGINGFTPQSITTATTGVGVAGATQTLTAAGVSTTITEAAPPAGYTLASIVCTGLGTGGTQTPVIGMRTVTLDAAATAAGAAIACTFTNTFTPPLPPVASIPTLSEWAMILLAALMAIAGIATIRRQQR